MTDSYRTPEACCVACGKPVDAASPATGGRAPQPGDVSLCFYCHHLMIYDEELKPRNPTDAEMVEIAGDPELVHAMTMLGQFKKISEELKNAQNPTGNRRTRRARDAGHGRDPD